MKKQLMMLITGLMYASLSFADTSYYVQSTNATIRSGPSFGAKVIAKVSKGQMLTSAKKSGDWIQVKIDGKDGYISHLLVTTHPPIDKTTVIKAEEEEIKPTARRRASSFTSAAAARGLTEEEQKREGIEKADYKAVDKMEAVKVTAEEVKTFKETGK